MAKLYYHYASMNAGKSARLLTDAYNYKERGMNVVIYKPMLDCIFSRRVKRIM